MATSDKIALGALVVSALGLFIAAAALLPLFWGAMRWFVSLQASDTVQAQRLDDFGSEMDLVQKFMAARIDMDLRVATEMAALKVGQRELERRASDMERRIDNGAGRGK